MQIPGYDIQQQLGKGGMADVYLAVQQSLHRQVALKVMSPVLAVDEEFSRRFIKEGQIIGRLNHPAIVTVFDIGLYESYHYLSMEYLSGGTLKERIQADELSTEQAVVVVRDMAEALAYAHQQGVIHRDVKPNNVMFRQDGTTVLTDFGVAKDLESTTQLTVTGITIGSINYMSPEQFRGGSIDARADLYALGVLFWEALTGELPYHSASNDPFSIALKHANAPVPSLPEALRRYQGLIDGLMAKQAEDRFASAGDFISALDRVAQRSAEDLQEVTQTLPFSTEESSADAQIAISAPQTTTETANNQGAGRWVAAIIVLLLLGGGGAYFARPLLPWFDNDRNPGDLAARLTREAHLPDSTQQTITAVPTAPTEPTTEPTPTPTAPTQPAELSVAALLALAESQMQVGKYEQPAGDNAAQTYNRVLAHDPSNQVAYAGLLKIGQLRNGDRYRDLALKALDSGDLQTSLAHIQIGLKLAPDHQGLLELQQNLEEELQTSASE